MDRLNKKCRLGILARPLPCLLFILAFNANARATELRPVEVGRCEVQFLEEIDTPALFGGPLAHVKVKVNDEVRQGQIVADVDDALLQLKFQTAKLERDAAAERLADDVELQFALTAQHEAEAELNASRDVVTRNPGVVTEVAMRRLRLAVERSSLDVEQTKKGRKLAEITLSIRSAELHLIDQQMARLKIVCPIDGVVRELYRRQGEWVGEGQAMAKIARLDRLRIDALVSAAQLDVRRCLGCRVTVRWQSASGPQTCHGQITSIDPQVFAGGQYRVHAEIENGRDSFGWKLLPGTDVQMTVEPPSDKLTGLPGASK